MDALLGKIRACTLCSERFGKTETGHSPRPVLRVSPTAKILVAGQAPGMKVHLSGKPFTDPSGDRLRAWMGVDEDTFYDSSKIGILPMGFCFPGYRNGSDLPPPAICAKTWRLDVLAAMPDIKLTLLIGGHAQKWHLPDAQGVNATVERWRDFLPATIPLPHPSWRNTAWLKRNLWFEAEVLPVLRSRIQEVLDD
ncbi:MAG: uracil-DNA glycosylase family protein [Pelagimonas sp.]|uniref:uracil-DNA glycosylase family protein n=1 Tax=Pelagimonas sp. TaxID=2073170 RepID=UPI003D6B84E7